MYVNLALKLNLISNCLPVSFAGAVHGSLVLLEVDQRDGQLGKVGDVVVEQLGGLVHALVKAPVTDLANVGVVGARDKLKSKLTVKLNAEQDAWKCPKMI